MCVAEMLWQRIDEIFIESSLFEPILVIIFLVELVGFSVQDV